MSTTETIMPDLEEMPKEEAAPKEEQPPKRATYITKFKQILEKRPDRVAIFTHPTPDPDAVGSMMGLGWLLQKFDIPSDKFFLGVVSHPQNRALVNLLDPDLRNVTEFNPKDYDFRALVDTVPSHAGIDQKVEFDLVIDHHKEMLNGGFGGLFINLRAGSACATVYHLIEKMGLSFEDGNDYDARVATAMMVGITTDTENLMSDDTTDYEFMAWRDLFPFREPNALKQIVNYERPKFWTDAKADAAKKAEIIDGIGVVGMGIIPAKHRDMIADMADEMSNWEDVNTSVAFAIVGNDRIEGSVRTKSASMSVPSLCVALGGKHGGGGGKLGKGAYSYALGGSSIDEDDDEHTKQKTWDLFNEKETKRILKIIKNK